MQTLVKDIGIPINTENFRVGLADSETIHGAPTIGAITTGEGAAKNFGSKINPESLQRWVVEEIMKGQ